MRTRLAVVAAITMAAVLLASCSGSSHGEAGHGGSSPSIPADAAFNATDVGFAQGMIPHHAQAIEMADMAIDKSTNADVLALAREIAATQSPEIATMTGWLESWGQKVPAADGSHDMSSHDMEGMDSMMMDGMMSAADMQLLANSSGTAFDRAWLELMILHHEGAVKMARQEVAGGKQPDVKSLAETIIATQQAEIDRMEQLLTTLPR